MEISEEVLEKIVGACLVIGIDRLQLNESANNKRLADHKAERRNDMLNILDMYDEFVPDNIKEKMRDYQIEEMRAFYEPANPFWGSWNGVSCAAGIF